MNDTTFWHVDDEQLAAYTAGRLDDIRSSSAEAHLVACALCRRQVSALVDADRAAGVWANVVDAVDSPRPGVVEWVLRRMGMAEASARMLAATPSLQLSWLLAVVSALGFSVLAAQAGGERRLALFLMVAPLLPLAGVAAAYGPVIDPTHETTSATPSAGFRLLLLRASAVFSVTFALATISALGLPGLDANAAAWVLPALGLTLSSLALSTVVAPEHAAMAVAAAWVLGVTAAAVEAHDWLAAFGPAGQVTFAMVILIAGTVVARRHSAFDVPVR